MKLLKTIVLAGCLLCTVTGSTQPVVRDSMQVVIYSAIHPQGGRLALFREWPGKARIDTLHSSNGQWLLPAQAVDGPAVYSVQLARPFKTIIFYARPGTREIRIAADSTVSITNDAQEAVLQAFDNQLKPLQMQMIQTGNAYTQEKDMEAKLAINEKNSLLVRQLLSGNMDFVRQHASDINGIWVAYRNFYMWDEPHIDSLLRLFEHEPLASVLLKDLQQKKQSFAAVNMLRKNAPLFRLPTTDGTMIAADSLFRNNELVLVDFWASWCAPCRAANRKIAGLYPQLQQKHIEIISISADESPSAWTKAIAADKIPWLQVRAPHAMDSEVIRDYKVSSLPAAFLVNREGVVIKQHLSFEELQRMAGDQDVPTKK